MVDDFDSSAVPWASTGCRCRATNSPPLRPSTTTTAAARLPAGLAVEHLQLETPGYLLVFDLGSRLWALYLYHVKTKLLDELIYIHGSYVHQGF